ncbi:MAG TPA: Gfo/Idh/MocA family oxidoreductase [Tepidisphaeraceae bacterium]|jgi:predicted dehydrogenase|nr:Gfo/Idh/MocA family oxidoreductase [Tepidisphaeraceae bacterium]
MIRIAAIGLGVRAASMLSTFMHEDATVALAAVADPAPEMVRQQLKGQKVPFDGTRFFDTADELLEHADEFDGIVIGTRCNLHTPLAIKVAPTGLPLYLEKPVGIDSEQLQSLHDAFVGRETSVVVSFPLRITPLMTRVMNIVHSGRLGIVNQVQAFNYVPYGGVYFGKWYRDYDVTGGLWLQKATHDFDYINRLVGAAPVAVATMGTRRIYGGHMPANLRCSACDRVDACPESPKNISARGDDGGMGRDDHECAFSDSIRHHDAASALISYANGVHASYAHNFVTRRSAGWRGARITGYKATLEFEWHTETIRVTEHHDSAVDTIKVEVPSGHHGGDTVLAQNFLDVIKGRDVSHATLADGILSAAMCVAARTSEERGTFERVVLPASRNLASPITA